MGLVTSPHNQKKEIPAKTDRKAHMPEKQNEEQANGVMEIPLVNPILQTFCRELEWRILTGE